MFVWLYYLYPSSVRFRRWPQTINQPGPPLYFAHPELHFLLDRCSSHLRRVKRNETGSKDWYKCEYDLVSFVFTFNLNFDISIIFIYLRLQRSCTQFASIWIDILETQNIVGILIHQLYHVLYQFSFCDVYTLRTSDALMESRPTASQEGELIFLSSRSCHFGLGSQSRKSHVTRLSHTSQAFRRSKFDTQGWLNPHKPKCILWNLKIKTPFGSRFNEDGDRSIY